MGYSPIIGVDADKIINDYHGNGYVIHVIRNPFSAYAETKKRPVALSLDHYITGWITCQYYATLFAKKYPGNCILLRYEDIINNPVDVLGKALQKIDLHPNQSLANPSWNGEELKEVYPWGTIRVPSEEVNLNTARELSASEIGEIYLRTQYYLERFEYMELHKQLSESRSTLITCIDQ